VYGRAFDNFQLFTPNAYAHTYTHRERRREEWETENYPEGKKRREEGGREGWDMQSLRRVDLHLTHTSLSPSPPGERREMVEIYTNKGGMSPPDATLVIDTLLRYPRFFIDNMVVWELGLLPLTKDFSVLRGREGGREGARLSSASRHL